MPAPQPPSFSSLLDRIVAAIHGTSGYGSVRLADQVIEFTIQRDKVNGRLESDADFAARVDRLTRDGDDLVVGYSAGEITNVRVTRRA